MHELNELMTEQIATALVEHRCVMKDEDGRHYDIDTHVTISLNSSHEATQNLYIVLYTSCSRELHRLSWQIFLKC